MATIKKRMNPKKQQPEQQIVTIANRVSALIAENRQAFLITVSVLAVIVVLVAGISFKRSMDEQKAAPQLAAAYETYDPSAGTKPDYAKALDLFRAVQKQYPSTQSGEMAAYYAANCLMDLGRREEALKEYQAFTQQHGGDKFLLGLVYQRMGYTYNEMGKQADAIKAFEQADSLIGPGASTVELARLYEASGNSMESQKKYKTVADKLAGTAWAMEASGKVQKIAPIPAAAQATNPKQNK